MRSARRWPVLAMASLGVVLALPDARAVAALSFLNPPEGAEISLELKRRFAHDEIPDTSTGTAQPTPNISPVDLDFFPDGSGALLTQSTGMIAWLGADYSLRGYFGVPSANSLANYLKYGEIRDNEGLLGLVFDPNFAQNRWFYIHNTPEPRAGIQIWRLTWDPSNLAGIWSSRQLILDVPKPQIADDPAYLSNHDGGNPIFGPDGMLYVLIGDGGIGGSDPAKNQSQSPTSSWGKVLRVDPTGAKPAQIVARGMRNPFTSSWFGSSLVIGDVGADFGEDWEEINLLENATTIGATVPNFGWNLHPGPCLLFVANPADCAGFVDPMHGYRKDHAFLDEDPDASPGPPGTVYVTAVVVGPVSDGTRYDGYLEDVLVYADFVQGWVRGALLSEDGRVLADRHLLHYNGLIPGLVKGPEGDVYLLGNDLGHIEIHRLTGPNVTPPPPPPENGPPLVDFPTDPMPRWLSRTGFFPSFPALTPDARGIAYAPTFPLWSDGTDKTRYLFLPAGTSIDTSDPEHWVFPVGTLVVKHFGYVLKAGGRREIETRVLQKLADGWRFGTYVWNAQQTEAELSNGRPVPVPISGVRGPLPQSFTYEIPGNAQCRSCHARQDDVVIGFEAMQLPAAMLRDLEQRGVLATPHDAAWQSVSGTTWSDAAVRGYLHANCAHCHSDEGGLTTTLGFSLDHRDTESVIGLPSRRGRGPLVDPGNPAGSALLRMLAGSPDVPRMPPLGPQIVDLAAVTQVSEWIRALAEVPDPQHPAGRDRVELIELYHPDLDRYVLATSADEAAALEASLGPAGWRRTGYGFAAWQRPATVIPGPRAVLRQVQGSDPVPPSRLGFRSVASGVRPGFPGTPAQDVVFYLYAPEGGRCSKGFDPVYQASVRRTGSPSLSYRYTTDLSVYRAMQANAWRGDGVVMCAPR